MLQINLKIKAFHPIYLDRFVTASVDKLKSFNIVQNSIVFLPQKIERFTVLRSPHVDKKARDQFERVTHKRLISFKFEMDKVNSYLKLYRILKILSTLSIGVKLEVQYFYSL